MFFLEGRLSVWSAGIAIAFIALILFLRQAPWGVAGGYRNWGDWFWYLGFRSLKMYVFLFSIIITSSIVRKLIQLESIR